ncbi:unnamed protein product [Clavelina lepadiformis]|uniref:Uncharacterized protein n=1 Tax=Clavelina lepadiformis TaxID=159417 RepID=A0ABP0FRU5_CLALP
MLFENSKFRRHAFSQHLHSNVCETPQQWDEKGELSGKKKARACRRQVETTSCREKQARKAVDGRESARAIV